MGNDVARDAHCEITMGNDIARDIHCDVTMSNDAAEPFLLCILCSIPNYYFITGRME